VSEDNAKGSAGKKDGDKADRIRAKVTASQKRAGADARAATKAKAAPKPVADPSAGGDDQRGAFKKTLDNHPLALLAGSVILGVVAASLIPASLGRKLGSRALGLAAVAGDLGAEYGSKALGYAAKGARAGQEKLDDVGETIAEKGDEARRRAVEMSTQARRRAVEMAEAAAANARDARQTALKRIGELSAKVRD
jgi:hypothetical protein